MRFLRNPADHAAFWRAVRHAIETYCPYNADDAYWQDSARGRHVFQVYVNGRAGGSLFVGQTGETPEKRLPDHRRRDAIYHEAILCAFQVPTRGHALGLEAHLCRHLRWAGFAATTVHSRHARVALPKPPQATNTTGPERLEALEKVICTKKRWQPCPGKP